MVGGPGPEEGNGEEDQKANGGKERELFGHGNASFIAGPGLTGRPQTSHLPPAPHVTLLSSARAVLLSGCFADLES